MFSGQKIWYREIPLFKLQELNEHTDRQTFKYLKYWDKQSLFLTSLKKYTFKETGKKIIISSFIHYMQIHNICLLLHKDFEISSV